MPWKTQTSKICAMCLLTHTQTHIHTPRSLYKSEQLSSGKPALNSHRESFRGQWGLKQTTTTPPVLPLFYFSAHRGVMATIDSVEAVYREGTCSNKY